MTIKTVTPRDLYRRIKLGHSVVLIDIRSGDEYDEGHIASANLYPLESFNAENIIHKVCIPYPAPPTIYVACASGSEAEEACQHLADAGYEYITRLEGGMYAWISEGLPIQKTRNKPPLLRPLPIHQQMQIAVGGIVALGTLLGTLVNTGLLVIPLLTGIGFAYEGFLGTEYLKQMLLKQSWNKNLPS